MFLCTHISDESVGIVDTDDFVLEYFSSDYLNFLISQGVKIEGFDGTTLCQYSMYNYIYKVGGIIHQDDFILLMPGMKERQYNSVRCFHLLFNNYYYRLEFVNVIGQPFICFHVNDDFVKGMNNNFNIVRHLSYTKDKNLMLGLSSNYRAEDKMEACLVFDRGGNVYYNGIKKRNLHGKPMSIEVFKRKLLVGGYSFALYL